MSTSKLKFLVFFTKCGFSPEFGQSLKPYMLKKLQFCFLKVYSFLFPLRKEKEKEKKEENFSFPLLILMRYVDMSVKQFDGLRSHYQYPNSYC